MPTNIKHTIEECNNLALSRGGLCLSTEYINNKDEVNEIIKQWLLGEVYGR